MKEPAETAKSQPLRVAWFFTNVFYGMGWLAAVLLVVLTVWISVTDFSVRYVRLPVEVNLLENSDGQVISPLTTGRSVDVAGFSYLKVHADRLPGLPYMMLMPMLLLAGLLYILFLLRCLLGNVRRNVPFAPENPRLLSRVGWLVAVAGPVYGILQYIYGKTYIGMVQIPDANLTPVKDIHAFVILAGLIIVVIAQVYDRAVKIKEEADLTI
ncbi:MAG: DUF2975 domain-containing protein [Candidatus Zixiibacteriota bacterium]|nr:MAG: DUF2975 domain-containing protein [candidate division Zixibacteria bacterium]